MANYETVDGASLPDLTARFEWWAATFCDVDPPGRNHGLALGAIRWRPPAGVPPG